MKNFHNIYEHGNPDNIIEYRNSKRETVLDTIKPICDAFCISDYDYYYIIDEEYLDIEGQRICCTHDSIGAVVNELICYIFMQTAFSKLQGYPDTDIAEKRITRCFCHEYVG